jgi:hypothetical protein
MTAIDPNIMTRSDLITNTLLRLGGQIVDVELDPEHLNLAVDRALRRYRQRAENAVEEKFIPLNIMLNQTSYKLDNNIIEVRDLYGHTTGSTGTDSGNQIEPFQAQYLNTFLLQGGATSGLATYDALAQNLELLGRMFGSEYTFTWNTTSHTLFIHRRPKSNRIVFMHCYVYRLETELFADQYVLPWLEDYTLAMCKMMLGEGRGKFASIAGPQGGTTLNGESLKAEGTADVERLEEDLRLYRDGSKPLGFIIG